MPRICDDTRKDGSPCTASVLGDGTKCWAHDPAMAEQRAEKRRLGGRNRSTAKRLSKLMPARLLPVFERLEVAFEETHAGDLDPRVAGALAQLSRAMIACVQAGEMEERLRQLEAVSPPADGRRPAW